MESKDNILVNSSRLGTSDLFSFSLSDPSMQKKCVLYTPRVAWAKVDISIARRTDIPE